MLWLTIAALVLATVLYVLTKNIVAAGVIVVCVALVWLEQFEMGRRMRNGTYGSRPRERADLVRWIEKHEHAED
ncbi:MAG TPA: hypothetical protein VMU25_03265 [Candidatus Paceibacterota bacterium]|nr:hypothetical protein [Candidatus Paceibacterota bacterium]